MKKIVISALVFLFIYSGKLFSTTFDDCYLLSISNDKTTIPRKIAEYEAKLKTDDTDYYSYLALGILYCNMSSTSNIIYYTDKFLAKVPGNPLALIYNGLGHAFVARDTPDFDVFKKYTEINKACDNCDRAVFLAAGKTYEWRIRYMRGSFYMNFPSFFSKSEIVKEDFKFIETEFDKNTNNLEIQSAMPIVYKYFIDNEKTPVNFDNSICINTKYAYSYNQAKALDRGTTLGTFLNAEPDEGSWTGGYKIQEWHADLITNGGFETVRIPICWPVHASYISPFEINIRFLNRVDEVIGWMLERKLRVVIDMQDYTEINKHPVENSNRFIKIWKQIARHYKNYPDTLYYELLNEPNDKLTVIIWNKIVSDAIREIRKIDGTHTIIVSAADWANPDGLYGLKIPDEETNCIVTFHFYYPFLFCFQGAEYLFPVTRTSNIVWPGPSINPVIPAEGIPEWASNWIDSYNNVKDPLLNPAGVKATHDVLASVYYWGQMNCRPLWMGEFCCHDAANMTSRSNWTAYVRQELEDHNIPWCYWGIIKSVPLYDTEKKEWVIPLMGVLAWVKM